MRATPVCFRCSPDAHVSQGAASVGFSAGRWHFQRAVSGHVTLPVRVSAAGSTWFPEMMNTLQCHDLCQFPPLGWVCVSVAGTVVEMSEGWLLRLISFLPYARVIVPWVSPVCGVPGSLRRPWIAWWFSVGLCGDQLSLLKPWWKVCWHS